MNALTKFNHWPMMTEGWWDDFFKPEGNYLPQVEIMKNENEYRIVAHIPGATRENVHVEVKDGYLQISGQFNEEKSADYEVVHSEIHTRTEFQRSLKLDETRFETEAIDAKLENGVLTVSLPLKEEIKPKRIEVRVD